MSTTTIVERMSMNIELHPAIYRWWSHGRLYAIYPQCCMSASCGGYGDDCTTCKSFPVLDSFKKWIAATGASVEDKIWSPSVYTAQTNQ